MKTIVDKGDILIVVYFDDIVVFGDDPDHVWAETVTVIQCLTEAGFMLNVKKSDFLKKEIKMLGFWVGGGIMRPNFARLGALANYEMSKTVR